MTRARASAAALMMALCLSACWSLTTDVDRIRGGVSDDGGAPDGRVPDRDGNDGSRDGGEPDGEREGSAAALCAAGGSHLLCDDFDTGIAFARWTQTTRIAGGQVELASSSLPAPPSPPNALRATLPAGCTNASAQLVKRIDGATPGQLTATFDLFLVATPPSEVLNLAGLSFPTSVGEYRVDLGFRADRLEVADNDIGGAGYTMRGAMTAALRRDGWRRIEATFSLTPTARVVVKVDGESVLDRTVVPRAPNSGASTAFDFGLFANSGCTAEVEARFDNVTLDFAAR